MDFCLLKNLFHRGDDARAEEINQQIQELDERAKELDKIRTSSISSISYINVRNRKKNVEEAEKAILVSLKWFLNMEIFQIKSFCFSDYY